MKKEEVLCDNCGGDITYTHNSIDYRISCCVERIPHNPRASSVTSMMIYPPLEHDHYFCGVGCLKEWAKK